MRLRLLLLVAVLLIPAAPVSAATDEPWVFEGGGWGHGVGMSQFGVLGQVEENPNKSVEKMLQHYYTGTSLGTVADSHWTNQPDGLWVGLAANTTSVNLTAAGGPVTLCQPIPDCSHLEQTITPGESWKFEIDVNDSTQCRLRRGSEENGGWNQCSASISDISTSNRISLNGSQYARGTVRFDPSPDGFHAVVSLDLESYLYGLAEVPSSWPAKALQVQAIAGRSYAVATAKERGDPDGDKKLSACGCHLWATTLDQAYVGWSKEDPANDGNRWTGAVDDTKAQVVTLGGATVKTFYSSSNGGWSENNEDVWGGEPRSYLRSVEDPWSANPKFNPLATWSVKVSDKDMGSYFGWEKALDAFILEGPPGVLIEFTGWDNGGPVSTTLNGTQVASLVKSLGFGYHAPGSPNSSTVRVSPYFTAVKDPPGFDDIVGNTFEADIEWLGAAGITKGCNPPDNTLFCPHDQVTRGQMAAFIKRFLDLPAASKDHFGDDNGSIFESDINAIAEAGITKGCNPPDNTDYCPTDRVTREQMAAFLVRALGLSANDHSGFDDVSDSNTFFNDIRKLATAGITKGCNPPDNTAFCPQDNVTRGQMAAFLHRADQVP